MSDQQDLRQRREAMSQAVNSHDRETVLSFIHPSFVGKTKGGWRIAGYQRVVRMLEQLCAPGSDYQETVEIEEIEVSGDSARLAVRLVARGASRSQESRTQETWRLIDGRWLLVESRQRDAFIKPRHILVAAVVAVAVGAFVAWGVFTGAFNGGTEFQRSGVPAVKLEVRRASTKMVEGWKPITLTEPETDVFFYTETGALTSRTVPQKDHTYYVSPEVELSNEDVIGTGVYFDPLGPFSGQRMRQARNLFWWPVLLVVSIALFVASWRNKNWAGRCSAVFLLLLGLYGFSKWASAEPAPDPDIWQVIVRFNDASIKKPPLVAHEVVFLVDGEWTLAWPAKETNSLWIKKGYSTEEDATRIAKGIVGP